MSDYRTTKEARRELKRANAAHGWALKQIPRDQWVKSRLPPGLIEVWRSKDFLVQVYDAGDGWERLSVCCASLEPGGRWKDGVSWDDLQRLKSQCGRGDRDAVECFPPDKDVVNVANMRHLFVYPVGQRFEQMWRAKP